MANLRSQVARVVFSGTLGSGSAPPEIWSTSYWLAAYGAGGATQGPDDMAQFDPASYASDHAAGFGDTLMELAATWVTLTSIKVNVFGLQGLKVKQVTDPTVELAHLSPGTMPSSATPTFVTAFGWRLQSTTASRGAATQGRMFLPPAAAPQPAAPCFDSSGHWDGAIVTRASSLLTPAWELLQASPTGGAVNWIPSVVTAPTVKNGLTQFSVNAADVTTAENNVWVLRSRKSALATGGVKTTHTSFA